MDTSGPENAGPVSALVFPLPPQPKNPGLAFLISLLLPGLGQFYCGKVKRGLWTLVFFLLAMAGVVFLFPHLEKEGFDTLWAIAFRTALVLYGFGFLDAYLTAREMSAGTHQHMLENPRVAAVLNLLTRGFGYWYVGERKKAIVFSFSWEERIAPSRS